ncbi:hypothetical protein HRR83_002893 [Exophiala dermatitidis]|uniref:Short chain dehydrogenase/reductase n=2 Tax=Exophiala dermatitidis TaxID=5970 RepID=H6BXR7_EXODN|nr:short chain dehydrogenase/reductase [Exophiala dermatitidis NIH/UT8656]KAJ4516705.1 hypothetical protein HRR75_003364 [Exophiala dermatitidis]EHY57407.1 short chain dehydrogenase/reductase [Exophiala dermatitidis NIH/UT8656]KAJ4520676.1 hypothetical protein HRR74_003676 [Exophiala dermatitidis]KAJ4521818.1 hypothetical protein HRR73_003016 [Exophiala dermatitidis]KAJ4537680.1 hypothetical protein HRR76_005670 [Exophiala dermatitidis]
MATPGPLERANRVLSTTLALPVVLLRYAVAEPLLTGSLLFALTRAPEQYRQRLLKLLRDRGISNDAIGKIVRSLKILLAVGVASRLNDGLNRLALNHWHLKKPGEPFKFGDTQKSELIVVTGGCSGFGYEMVKSFSRHARVAILDIAPVPEDLEIIPGVSYYKVDLTDFAAIEATAETIRKEHGHPSVLINNAGVGSGTTVINSSAKLTDRIFKVNLASHFVLIKEFLPGMLEARKGHIVTIASMASFYAAPGLVDYCCTKVGALFLHEGLRAELRSAYPNGNCIQTTCVHPSWHKTGIVKPYEEHLTNMGVRLDPATNVSDAVVEQVLAARSGQVFVPRSEKHRTGLRALPIWAQDVIMYWANKRSRLLF